MGLVVVLYVSDPIMVETDASQTLLSGVIDSASFFAFVVSILSVVVA